MIKIFIPIDWYDTHVYVTANCTREEHYEYVKQQANQKELEHEKDDQTQGEYCSVENGKTKALNRFIWLREFNNKQEDHGVLVHEVIHLVTAILDFKGVPIRLENDEVIAYGVESIYKKIARSLNFEIKTNKANAKKKMPGVRKKAKKSRAA